MNRVVGIIARRRAVLNRRRALNRCLVHAVQVVVSGRAVIVLAANGVLRRVKTVHQPVMVLIVRPLLIAVSAVIAALTVRSVAVTVIRVQRGAAMIALRRVVNTLMQHLRNVANSHRALSVLSVPTVLSAPTVPATTICRFSAQRG